MNPNAAIFYPKLSTQEVYYQTISTIPYMSSVMENLFFDNLENEFVKNNKWLFENEDEYFINKVADVISKNVEDDTNIDDAKNLEDDTKDCFKRKNLTVNTRKSKIIITFK
jgi:hypothetical protein